jgi:DNA-directed RNA polymerase subunit RPC12/RpoP
MTTTLRFCAICENMLYASIEDGKFVMQCKSCSYMDVEHDATDEAIVLDETDLSSGRATACTGYIGNPMLVHDPTLPRVNNIVCTNASGCTRKADAPNDVICIKYDAERLKYLYICSHCNHAWDAAGESI